MDIFASIVPDKEFVEILKTIYGVPDDGTCCPDFIILVGRAFLAY